MVDSEDDAPRDVPANDGEKKESNVNMTDKIPEKVGEEKNEENAGKDNNLANDKDHYCDKIKS